MGGSSNQMEMQQGGGGMVSFLLLRCVSERICDEGNKKKGPSFISPMYF